MVQRLDGLRLHAVVRRHHEDRDVGDLCATGTHGREGLVTGCIDEGDLALGAISGDRGHLVGADVLRDAAGLATNHVGLADGIQQAGLAVVDVTHDCDDRRTDLEIVLAALVLAELEVVGLEQLAVLVLRRYDLDVVVQLGTEQAQRVVVDRLGRGDHLTETDQHLDQIGRHRVDLLGEVGQARAARQSDGLALAALDPDTVHDRRLHVVELLALGPLGLATTGGTATGTAEGARRRATATGATGAAGEATRSTGTTRTTGSTCTSGTRTTGATTCVARTSTTGTARTATGEAGTRATGATGTTRTTTRATGTSRTTRRTGRPRRPGRHRAGVGTGGTRHGRCGPAHAGTRAVGVVARARTDGAAHAGAGAERVVARARTSRARGSGRAIGALGSRG